MIHGENLCGVEIANLSSPFSGENGWAIFHDGWDTHFVCAQAGHNCSIFPKKNLHVVKIFQGISHDVAGEEKRDMLDLPKILDQIVHTHF